MAITKKPQPKAKPQGVDVDALIRKGGSIAGEGDAEAQGIATKPATVILRLPADVLDRVDRAVQARRIKMPRHTWLLEAVVEKLDKESH